MPPAAAAAACALRFRLVVACRNRSVPPPRCEPAPPFLLPALLPPPARPRAELSERAGRPPLRVGPTPGVAFPAKGPCGTGSSPSESLPGYVAGSRLAWWPKPVSPVAAAALQELNQLPGWRATTPSNPQAHTASSPRLSHRTQALRCMSTAFQHIITAPPEVPLCGVAQSWHPASAPPLPGCHIPGGGWHGTPQLCSTCSARPASPSPRLPGAGETERMVM